MSDTSSQNSRDVAYDRDGMMSSYRPDTGATASDLNNMGARDIAELLVTLADSAASCTAYVDWSAFSTPARDATLMQQTGDMDISTAKAPVTAGAEAEVP